MTASTQVGSNTFTVQEAAVQTGLSEHTLRYYERVNLIPRVQRDNSSKHRRYTQQDLRGIEFLKRMRATGMPICEMQRYVRLYLQGEETLAERLAMLEAHQQRVQDQIAELQAHLAVIDFKIENYKHLETNRNWTGADCLDIREQARQEIRSEGALPDLSEGQRGASK
ncbi:MAG: MerR family transcriptional regulator [Chthonomonadaceae bacterium]|nr:MerR family transcriptional regulator [Chthonomonadaceae bacterium]